MLPLKNYKEKEEGTCESIPNLGHEKYTLKQQSFGVFLCPIAISMASRCQIIPLTASLLQHLHFHKTFALKAHKVWENNNS